MEPTPQQPSLKVTALGVERHRSLRPIRWPADATGWEGEIPDLVTIGGDHASGKTLLLELIAHAVRALTGIAPPFAASVTNAWVDIRIKSPETGEIPFRVVMGEADFVEAHKTAACLCLFRREHAYEAKPNGIGWHKIHRFASSEQAFTGSQVPGAVYLPADRRFDIPAEPIRASGRLVELAHFFFRLNPPKERRDSVEAFLYGARWKDMNARPEDRPAGGRHFERCQKAFQAFAGNGKRFVFRGGDLFVEITATGETHSLMELSSGEKYALLVVVELFRRWRPGSLILIDEPDKHLNPAWQTILWTMLKGWQRERGGQLMVATRSEHLLGLDSASAFRM